MNFPNKQRGQFGIGALVGSLIFSTVFRGAAQKTFSGNGPGRPPQTPKQRVASAQRRAAQKFELISGEKAPPGATQAELRQRLERGVPIVQDQNVVEALPFFLDPPLTPNVPVKRSPLPIVISPPDVTEETEEKPVSNGFELIPFINAVGGAAQGIGSLINPPRAAAPAPAQAGLLRLPSIGGVGRGLGASLGLGGGFLGLGDGNGTPLQRAREATGRPVSRKQIILAARHCGLEVASETFGISVTDVCMVVARGMPRRGRGISSSDLRRTRSTLRKMQTMTKSLRSLCPPARSRRS